MDEGARTLSGRYALDAARAVYEAPP